MKIILAGATIFFKQTKKTNKNDDDVTSWGNDSLSNDDEGAEDVWDGEIKLTEELGATNNDDDGKSWGNEKSFLNKKNQMKMTLT